MELEARVIQLLPVESGTSKAGKAWQSQCVIVETLGQYPKKVMMKFFGDKTIKKAAALRPGDHKSFSFDLESREFNGRWYTDVNCWHVTDPYGAQTAAPRQQAQTYTPPAQYGQPQTGAPNMYARPLGSPYDPPGDEDLPF